MGVARRIGVVLYGALILLQLAGIACLAYLIVVQEIL